MIPAAIVLSWRHLIEERPALAALVGDLAAALEEERAELAACLDALRSPSVPTGTAEAVEARIAALDALIQRAQEVRK